MSAQSIREPDDEPEFREDAAAVARVEQTLDMARAFVRSLFDDPSLIDEIPEGANVVFVPDDNEDQRVANLTAAAKMRRAGRTVYLANV